MLFLEGGEGGVKVHTIFPCLLDMMTEVGAAN